MATKKNGATSTSTSTETRGKEKERKAKPERIHADGSVELVFRLEISEEEKAVNAKALDKLKEEKAKIVRQMRQLKKLEGVKAITIRRLVKGEIGEDGSLHPKVLDTDDPLPRLSPAQVALLYKGAQKALK